MLLAEVTGGRRDDRALGDNQLPARLNRHAHVFLTDEIKRRLVGRRLLATLKGSPYIAGLKGSPYIVGLNLSVLGASRLEASRHEEFVDPAGQRVRADTSRGG